MSTRHFGSKEDTKFWADKPIQEGHPKYKQFRIWGIHKKYKGLSWLENFMGGHISVGRNTIYGENAMNWAVNLWTGKKYLCFTLPTLRRIIGKDEWYLYLSTDGTPNKSDWYKGTKRSF